MGDVDFKVKSIVENSNKFQKTKFWKEKSVENAVPLRPMAQATLVRMNLKGHLFTIVTNWNPYL